MSLAQSIKPQPHLIILLAITLMIFSHFALAQCSTHIDDLVLDTQEKVDNFRNLFPGCSQINTFSQDSYLDITIKGGDITNLDGLAQLSYIPGFLIIDSCPNLIDISGLKNIKRINKHLIIKGAGIKNLSGLSSLEYAGGIRLQNNFDLAVGDLPNLSQVGSTGVVLFNNVNLDECTVPHYKRALCLNYVAFYCNDRKKDGIRVKANVDVSTHYDDFKVTLNGNSHEEIEYESDNNSFFVPKDMIQNDPTFSLTAFKNSRKVKNKSVTIQSK